MFTNYRSSLTVYLGSVLSMTGFYMRKQLWSSDHPVANAFHLLYYAITVPLLADVVSQKVFKLVLRYKLKRYYMKEDRERLVRGAAFSEEEQEESGGEEDDNDDERMCGGRRGRWIARQIADNLVRWTRWPRTRTTTTTAVAAVRDPRERSRVPWFISSPSDSSTTTSSSTGTLSPSPPPLPYDVSCTGGKDARSPPDPDTIPPNRHLHVFSRRRGGQLLRKICTDLDRLDRQRRREDADTRTSGVVRLADRRAREQDAPPPRLTIRLTPPGSAAAVNDRPHGVVGVDAASALTEFSPASDSSSSSSPSSSTASSSASSSPSACGDRHGSAARFRRHDDVEAATTAVA